MTICLRFGLTVAAALTSLSALAGCDQATKPAPPDIAGVYVVDRLCRVTVYDGSIGCQGTCRLSAAVYPTATGRTRFTLRSEPDFASGYYQDAGESTSSFDLTLTADGRRLAGTADFECSYHDGIGPRMISYPDVPFRPPRPSRPRVVGERGVHQDENTMCGTTTTCWQSPS